MTRKRLGVRDYLRHNTVLVWVILAASLFFVLVPPVQSINALTLGAIYALIALGYTMVYGIVELINFAHGDVFMVGTFVALSLLSDVIGVTGALNDPLQLALLLFILLAVTMVLMGALGYAIERLAYRPLRLSNAPKLAPLFTAIGVSFILQNLIQIWKGPFKTVVPQIIPMDAALMLGGVRLGVVNVIVIALALAFMIALQLFITRSKTGRAMRATALDPTAAALMGVMFTRGPDAILAKGTTIEMVLDRQVRFDESELDFTNANLRRSSDSGNGPLPSSRTPYPSRVPGRRF